MALFGRFVPDLIPGKSLGLDVGGGWGRRQVWYGEWKILSSVSSSTRKEGNIIVEGISTGNKIIQREERVGITLREKQATGERAAARQCLPPGRASGRRQRRALGEPGGLWGGSPGRRELGPRAGCRALKGWVAEATARRRASPGSRPAVIVASSRLVAAAAATRTPISAA